MDRVFKLIICLLLMCVSIGLIIVLLPIMYSICFICDIYWTLRGYDSLANNIKHSIKLIHEEMIDPYIDGVKELWKSI
jgi:hypothetical protein